VASLGPQAWQIGAPTGLRISNPVHMMHPVPGMCRRINRSRQMPQSATGGRCPRITPPQLGPCPRSCSAKL
jgi:hypothetical protein